MTRAQILDMHDELVEVNENLLTILEGVDMDDMKTMKPLAKISQELSSFIGMLDEASQQ